MALFRRFFYRKPPDRLLEISERVYVFDCCFSTDVLEEDEYKVYLGGIVPQLQDYFPDASFMVFNFREGVRRSQISDVLSQYDMTVMDYPRQYEGVPFAAGQHAPLLKLEMKKLPLGLIEPLMVGKRYASLAEFLKDLHYSPSDSLVHH